MKKLLLIMLLYLLSSCADDILTNPYQPYEFMGMWGNELTLVNGHLNDEVNKYSFLLTQDGAILYIKGVKASDKYLVWKVYNDSIFLRKSPSDLDIEYKVLVWPDGYDMTLARDSVIYKLHKNFLK